MKYALVTGGSRGIGRAIAQVLADMDYHLLINYKSNTEAAEQTAQLIRDAGGSASLLPFDVGDKDAVEQALSDWASEHPEDIIEVLVNNAGIRKDNLMAFMEDSDWQDVLDIHLGGFFYTTRGLLKQMIRNKYGRIINIVSLSGIKGMPGQVNYSAAKAAIIGASKALAQEVARKKITVNCIAPGFIRTDMTEDMDEGQLKNMIPARRFGTAQEVAAVARFLAAEDSSYITGEVISVNGGLYT